jgi:hypothetical protein
MDSGNKKDIHSDEPAAHGKATPREPYEPPKATFVPLKMEERVLSCGKAVSPCFGPGAS